MSEVENTEKAIGETIDLFANFIDWMQRLLFVVPIIFAVVCFLCAMLFFRHRCKNITEKQIQNYISAGKYIRGLFVELNDSREQIRAFCFSDLWKKRVIRKYNALFNDKMGKEFLHVFSEKTVNLRISSVSSIMISC